VKAPRNFTLDPKLYGRPVSGGYFSLYPAMRAATVLVGIFLVIALGAEILRSGMGLPAATEVDQLSQAIEPASEAEFAAEEAEMAEDEEPLKMQQVPEEALEGVDGTLETELAAEANVMEEPAAEEALRAAEPEIEEEREIAAEEVVEALTPSEDTSAGTAVIGEEMAAEAVESPMAPPSPIEAEAETEAAVEGELQATPMSPSGGGGERPTEPIPEAIGTPAAERTEVSVTESAATLPTITPLPSEPATPIAAVDEGEESAVETGPPSTSEARPQIMPTQESAQEAQEVSPEIPILRLVIIGLGIALVFLAIVTLLIRQQMKI
jgi:hypothetical protein